MGIIRTRQEFLTNETNPYELLTNFFQPITSLPSEIFSELQVARFD